MTSFNRFFSGLFALALLGAMAVGLYYLFAWILEYLRRPESQVAPNLTAIILGAIFLALLVLWSRGGDREAPLVTDKAETYQRFLVAWLRALESSDCDRVSAEAELRMAEREFSLLASSAVLRAYKLASDLEQPPQTEGECWRFEKVLKAMRADLRQPTVGLKRGDLVLLLFGQARRSIADESMQRFET